LPFHAAVHKHDTTPQAEMQNSAQQYGNIADAFVVDGPVPDGPAYLIDDLADSRWTLAVGGARLRKAGSGPLFPLVLATGTGE
jgi:ATP-dependent DNA helicase RecQ